MADDVPPSEKLPEPGYYHIPSHGMVECIPAHRKPTDVRIWSVSSSSCVGTVPPLTATPHWPVCWARRERAPAWTDVRALAETLVGFLLTGCEFSGEHTRLTLALAEA